MCGDHRRRSADGTVQGVSGGRGCSVAMNPYTGEVLALVSTPPMTTMILSWDCRMRSGNC